MKHIKLLSLLLAIAMMLTLFAGCVLGDRCFATVPASGFESLAYENIKK